MKKSVIFFPNGVTAVFGTDDKQIPELQRSWLSLFFKFLEDHDENPTEFEFTLPDGKRAIPHEKEDGSYGWSVE